VALVGRRHGAAGVGFQAVPLGHGHALGHCRAGHVEAAQVDKAFGGQEGRGGQAFDPVLLAMPQRVVEQRLAQLAARVGRVQRLGGQRFDERTAPRRPRHRLALQEGLTDGAGLLVLALQFELAGFLRPLFLG